MVQQDTATDRLISIIELIQLGRRTGTLTVKRGEGNTLEEGMIVFVNGQIIQAQTGRYSGSEAMNRLSAWEACRFIFASSDTSDEDTLPSPGSFKGMGGTRGDQHIIGSLSGPGNQSSQGPMPSREPVMPQQTGALNTFSHPPSPVPRRRVDFKVALHMLEREKLSRSHHRLLLLIDGKRSIQELVRLMSRTEKEVQILLGDLEQASIITFHPVPPSR